MEKLKVLDLFSGIGGFSLGLERTGGFETVAFCEIEEFSREILKKHWPNVPCYNDIRKLEGKDIGAVDVICGGYPCQPFSTAGKRRGKKDDRHLWPEFFRLVVELRPAWVIGENVAGHISMGLDDVLSDLESEGYTCRTFVIPACAKGAPHRRERCWIIAAKDDPDANLFGPHREGINKLRGCKPSHGEIGKFEPLCEVLAVYGCSGIGYTRNVPDANSGGQQRPGRAERCLHPEARENREVDRVINDGGWPPEPGVGRVANGVSFGVDRLKALGNAVIPQIPEEIGRAILSSMEETQ